MLSIVGSTLFLLPLQLRRWNSLHRCPCVRRAVERPSHDKCSAVHLLACESCRFSELDSASSLLQFRWFETSVSIRGLWSCQIIVDLDSMLALLFRARLVVAVCVDISQWILQWCIQFWNTVFHLLTLHDRACCPYLIVPISSEIRSPRLTVFYLMLLSLFLLHRHLLGRQRMEGP